MPDKKKTKSKKFSVYIFCVSNESGIFELKLFLPKNNQIISVLNLNFEINTLITMCI